MIPMAISLGFGVLFATLITLVLTPTLYMVVEDVKGLFERTDDEELKEESPGRITVEEGA